MSESIFEFSELLNIDSPFKTNWLQNSSSGSSTEEVLFLNNDRTYAIKTETLIKFKLKGDWGYIDDPDYTVEIKSSNSSLKISTKKWVVEREDKMYTKISLDTIGTVYLYLYINGVKKNTFKVEFIVSNDVFKKDSIKRLKDEFIYMEPFCDDEVAPEYDENYCMQGAERALSELLKDKKTFYSIERKTHKHLNSISLIDQTTYTRAEFFKSKGYILGKPIKVESVNFKVDHDKRNALNNSPNYESALAYYRDHLYEFVEMGSNRSVKFLNELKKVIDSKEPGWHVYYLSVTDGFHTLILLIDNTMRDYPKYEIWDNHGITTSTGDLDDIVKGLDKQSSWTFGNTCLIRYQKGTKNQYDKQTLALWKIKAK